MSMEPMRAPHWTEQPSVSPAEGRGPFLTPAARALLRAAGIATDDARVGGTGASVLRSSDVRVLLAERVTPDASAEVRPVKPFTVVSTRVVVDATGDFQARIAIAAAAAARAMREQRPGPVGALLRRPLPDHREQAALIEDVLILNTEAIARRLDASSPAEAPYGGDLSSVELEVLDLSMLGLTGFTSAPQSTTVILGQPQSSVVPVRDSLGATAFGIADVIDLTVHSTDAAGLHAGAHIARTVARALALKEAP